ncbi:MAG: glycosyltransferase [Hahellaceae bacterium]|nr:glycosyltransferase [Hahellaceae bacterium]MCP5210257.1 glycosyltransferase [Hahellaceae bacterium]
MKKSKSRVHVQVVQHLSPGGIETLSLDLHHFSQPDVQVHIVSLEGKKAEMLARWPRLHPFAAQLHFLDKPSGVSVNTMFKLAALLLKLRANLVHTHHIGPMLYGGIAARMAGVRRLIHTEHDAWHLGDISHQKIAQRCVKYLRPTLVADADLVASHLREKVPQAKPSIIHNGIDTKRFCPGNQVTARVKLGLPLQVRVLGCAARMHAVKGHDVLLDALFRLPAHTHLALAGSGETEPAIRQQVKDLNLTDRVHFLGHVEDMPAFYRAIDVFCLASHNEGMPLSPLEAQACGTAAVLTDVGACRETVCPRTGYIVAPGDSLALAAAIQNALRQRVNVSPRQFVTSHRDVKKMVSQYDALAGLSL